MCVLWACPQQTGRLVDPESARDVCKMQWLPFSYSNLKELVSSESQKILGLRCPKPKPLEVLIIGSTLVEFLSGIIQESVKDRYDLTIAADACGDRILGGAGDRHYDLFVLILDNIVFPKGSLPAKSTVNQAFRLLIHLKAKYKKPLIALYAWPKHPSYGRQAKLAGADVALEIPCPSAQIRAAVGRCLQKLAEAL